MYKRQDLHINNTLEDLSKEIRDWRNGSGTISLPKPRPNYTPKNIYLSGGISKCPDWQTVLTNALEESPITIVDPRNRKINVSSLSSLELCELATENHRMLLECEAFCVWFPEESKSPASLFELGALASMLERPLFVGAHPNYFRSKDVKIQTRLIRPEIKVVDSLQELAEQARRYYRMRG